MEDVVRLSHTSVRTLHHDDAVGLFVRSGRSAAGVASRHLPTRWRPHAHRWHVPGVPGVPGQRAVGRCGQRATTGILRSVAAW